MTYTQARPVTEDEYIETIDVSDRSIAEIIPSVRLEANPPDYADLVKDSSLTDNQKTTCLEILGWLSTSRPDSRIKVLPGFAGTGKTYLTNNLVRIAVDSGLIGRDEIVAACAPTHQAVKVLRKNLQHKVVQTSTVQSLLGIRPQRVTFLRADQQLLDRLLATPELERLADQDEAIEALQRKAAKAAEQVQEFTSNLKAALQVVDMDHPKVRLIILDEAGMASTSIIDLFTQLIACTENTELKILLMGDPAQLPPVGEKIGKAFTFPAFTPLTEVVRYEGKILDYCSALRTDENYLSSHYKHLSQGDDDSFISLPQATILDEIVEEFKQGTSIRFIAATNNRVYELNSLIRAKLFPGSDLNYATGDLVITNAPIEHDVHSNSPNRLREDDYQLSCNGTNLKSPTRTLVCPTSTIVRLGQKLRPGDLIEHKSPSRTDRIEIMESDLSLVIGNNTFKRNIFKYSHVEEVGGDYIALLDFAQYGLYLSELKRLADMAKSTFSRSKKAGVRGQSGDTAKEAWKELKIKNWDKHLDGTAISDEEYRSYRAYLWRNYYRLKGFVDAATYSYATTCHRAQGSTIDLVILDTHTLMKSHSYNDDTWDLRKLLYTAATRASQQLILMTQF